MNNANYFIRNRKTVNNYGLKCELNNAWTICIVGSFLCDVTIVQVHWTLRIFRLLWLISFPRNI